ncbi:MAG: hypothetical protein ACK5KL_04580 [Dysgonomonas sp.]
MKKIILTVFLLTVYITSNAQSNLPYKPLSAFGTDTTAFIIYNFMDRADYYKGKTTKEVVEDLQIPIKHYVENISARGTMFIGLHMYIYNEERVNYLRDHEKDYNSIGIRWENDIRIDDPEYIKFEKNWPSWYSGGYDYVKDMKIKEVYVVIPDYSKYYEKYKEKETKSSKSKRRLKFNF